MGPSGPDQHTPDTNARPSLQVQPHQVEEVRALFQTAAEYLWDLIEEGQKSLRMRPMADDEVSKDAADGFTRAGTEGPESHVGALRGYRDWLLGIANGFTDAARQYRNTDDTSALVFRGIDGA